MKRPILLTGLLASAGLITVAGLAWAGSQHDAPNDAVTDLAKAKVSLVQAVQTAQAQAPAQPAQATQAELDSEHGSLAYRVEVVDAKQQALDVRVDAISGKVLSSRADRADHESDHEDDHDD
jgi:uncharacterized membrane protein YkoI